MGKSNLQYSTKILITFRGNPLDLLFENSQVLSLLKSQDSLCCTSLWLRLFRKSPTNLLRLQTRVLTLPRDKHKAEEL